jgi:predicted GNAT family acetyltransferase
VPNLRRATIADLKAVMLVQGEMAFAESGVNPIEVDPEGFRRRCARRIEQQRVWVWVADGRLIFKADVISDTPYVIYLEGTYINPQDRRQGFGARCMSQLARTLLTRTASLCLFVNERSEPARCFFEQIGFELRSCYETIFLERSNTQIQKPSVLPKQN